MEKSTVRIALNKDANGQIASGSCSALAQLAKRFTSVSAVSSVFSSIISIILLVVLLIVSAGPPI